MDCPDCGGAMWDNRESKKKPTHPDYKCKNRSCDKAIWLKPKDGGSGNRGGKPAASGDRAPARPTGPLAPVYGECMEIASRAVKHYIGKDATPADIIAATATLFIGATNTGRPVKATNPPPPKPKPAPPPEPEPEEEEYPEYSSVESLPF